MGVPCANRVTWKLGYMQSLFWADSIKSYGRLLRDEEADRADRVPAQSSNLRIEMLGAKSAWDRTGE